MNIAIITPKAHSLSHRVRGSGFYIESLSKSLPKYDKNNNYRFIPDGDIIPKKTDLVHYSYFEPFFLTLPFFKSKKSVVTVHDLIPLIFPKYFPKGIKGEIKWQVQKLSLRMADSIITDSNCSKKDIIKYCAIAPQKINVVYLAAGENFKAERSIDKIKKIKQKYSLPEKFILYVGDVTWNKNLPRLINAANVANVPLAMVGKALVEKEFDKKNPWNQDLSEVQKLSEGNKNIMRLGFVPDYDLTTLYNAATLFVMPSLYEGFGLPILEAMSCGCPVITSNNGSIPEIAGEACLYIDAYDINSITKGIKGVFENTILQKNLSEKGLVQAKKFSWKNTAEETIAIYKKVLK